MERNESRRLASRALSIFFGVFGLYDTTYLPERLFSYPHYTNEVRSVGVASAALYLPTLYRITVAFLFLRIAIDLTLAVIFWKCGPWVQRTLLPESEP